MSDIGNSRELPIVAATAAGYVSEEELKEAGLVEPLYPDQPKHPKQKYRLTEQGKALLERGE